MGSPCLVLTAGLLYNSQMLKIIRTSLILLAMLCSQTSWAILHLTLNQGVNSAVPIAVLAFTGETADTDISAVLSADLQNSGRFKNEASTAPATADAITDEDLNHWKQQHVNYVINGSVQLTPSNQYHVQVNVFDVYKNSATDDQPATPILQQQFTITAKQFRTLAHHFSDVVYQKILGTRGVFSTKIAYVLVQHENAQAPSYQLMIADYDGENAAPVLMSKQPIMSPAWSPNGQSIAYVSFESGMPAIYISNITNGKRRLITKFAGVNSAPSFSLDGTKLAIVLSRGSTPAVYTVNLRNGSLKKITRVNAINTAPEWSANGQDLLFTSDRGGTPQIYQINVRSKAVQRVSFSGNYNANAEIAAGRKSIVFLHRGDDSNQQFVIAMQDLAAGNISLLTQGNAGEPSIAPNGGLVIYAKQQAPGVSQLGMVSTDGRVQLQLPVNNGSVQSPAWSPYLKAGSFS